MRILVVDDDKKLLFEVERILTRNGHMAHCVDNADDAIELLKLHHFDIALVDYRMPGHDGAWFLKNASLSRRTKALLVTSFLERDVIREMFSAGIAGYVTKPFDESELLRHLDFHSGKYREHEDIVKTDVSP